jgi:GT2 family glycosyltransferase/glycosyltransferase involved in cell wall biosynthesis
MGYRARVGDVMAEVEERSAQLREEAREARSEVRGSVRRLDALDRERARRLALVETAEAQVARAAGSRSFRYGHGLMRAFSLLAFRRAPRRTGLDAAAELLADARRELAPAAVSSVLASLVDDGPASLAPPPDAASRGRAESPAPAASVPAASVPAASVPRGRAAARRREAATAREQALSAGFRDRYGELLEADGAAALADEERGVPLPRDCHGMLLARAGESEDGHPGVDVIVCVHDAPDDVRRCLWSLIHNATRPFHLVVVDDGSGPETAALLDDLARREPAIELIRNDGPDHGYTRAANIGLRASTGSYAILLNSDTVVTPGWLERIVACGESDERIGVVGPLSNAATHQSIPAVKADGRWAVNPLPPWLTAEAMGLLVGELSDRERPRVPFVNGFCFAIKRAAIDEVGLFDEELFGSGYCEENDFSIRARDAGFSLALADDAYVFHVKSSSYTADGRDRVASRNYQLFLDKHGEERVRALLEELEDMPGLERLRDAVAFATESEEATVAAFRAANPRPLEVLFVLHGMPDGSSGGGHSIYQETSALRRLGVPARIAIGADAIDRARAAYPDADELFAPFADEDELADHAATADVVVATHYTTVALVRRLRERLDGFQPAYYVQDYEPFFAEPGSPQLAEARASYTAISDQIVFAKTHWLCNLVGELHGIHVAKVEPSLDRGLFNVDGRVERPDGPVRIAAMIRPRTPRRQPVLTLDVLSDLAAARPDDVEIATFGCPAESIDAFGRTPPGHHLGLLTRDQVADLLKRTDIFLDASTYQAFGRTAIEAMACGCAPIVPRIGGAPQFVNHRENGLLVDTLRPEAVAEALDELTGDPTLRRNLQRAAVAEARGYSTLRAALSEYAVFERALDLRPAAIA